MPTLSPQALRITVVTQLMSDQTFRDELKKDPVGTITKRFGAQPYEIKVIFDEKNDVSFLVPRKTKQLEGQIERSVADIGDRSPTRSQFDAVLIQKAWNDAAFKKQLDAAPQAAIDSLLKERGFSLPSGRNLRVYQEKQDGECLIVVPAPVEDLAEEELEAVAGGCSTSAIVAAGSVIIAEWVCC
jgi:hypothetical protein